MEQLTLNIGIRAPPDKSHHPKNGGCGGYVIPSTGASADGKGLYAEIPESDLKCMTGNGAGLANQLVKPPLRDGTVTIRIVVPALGGPGRLRG
jgi:hypothetical protein